MRSFVALILVATGLSIAVPISAQDASASAPRAAGAPSGQETPSSKDHKADHRTAQEAQRICALHGNVRAAELKKFKKKSGLDLYCPND